MKLSVYGEVVFKSVFAIAEKKVKLLAYNLTTTKLSSHEAWVECTCVVEFQLSYGRYIIENSYLNRRNL